MLIPLLIAPLLLGDVPEAFYAKAIDYHGIPIRASAEVSDEALREAWGRLYLMLHQIPDATETLRHAGAELHVIGRHQGTSDLPENREWKGRLYEGTRTLDERTRGRGGLAASCGEENLLQLSDDRYQGRDICVHEFAHTLLAFGLSQEIRDRVKTQYEASRAKGLWADCYASKNYSEFFAELSMWYFGTFGDKGKLEPRPGRGPRWLRQYDPAAFDLLDQIYTGALASRPRQQVILAHRPTSEEGTTKSTRGLPETMVRFDNDTSEPLSLYWLDFSGQRKSYGKVGPKSKRAMETYVTHAWLVVDDQGRAVALVVAQPEDGVAVITDADLPGR
jgi:alpha-glucosidase